MVEEGREFFRWSFYFNSLEQLEGIKDCCKEIWVANRCEEACTYLKSCFENKPKFVPWVVIEGTK